MLKYPCSHERALSQRSLQLKILWKVCLWFWKCIHQLRTCTSVWFLTSGLPNRCDKVLQHHRPPLYRPPAPAPLQHHPPAEPPQHYPRSQAQRRRRGPGTHCSRMRRGPQKNMGHRISLYTSVDPMYYIIIRNGQRSIVQYSTRQWQGKGKPMWFRSMFALCLEMHRKGRTKAQGRAAGGHKGSTYMMGTMSLFGYIRDLERLSTSSVCLLCLTWNLGELILVVIIARW